MLTPELYVHDFVKKKITINLLPPLIKKSGWSIALKGQISGLCSQSRLLKLKFLLRKDHGRVWDSTVGGEKILQVTGKVANKREGVIFEEFDRYWSLSGQLYPRLSSGSQLMGDYKFGILA